MRHSISKMTGCPFHIVYIGPQWFHHKKKGRQDQFKQESKQKNKERIKQKKNTKARTQVAKNVKKNNRNINSTIVVKNIEDEIFETFTIVNPGQSNPLEGKISVESPVGSALANAKAGSIVEIKIPSGKVTYEIISIDGMHKNR